MNILIIGGGGREHSIARSISISKNCNKIYILPGNAGTAEVGENIEGDVNDFNLIKKTVLSNQISVVFVGPEDPIVNGIYDFFKKEQLLKISGAVEALNALTEDIEEQTIDSDPPDHSSAAAALSAIGA